MPQAHGREQKSDEPSYYGMADLYGGFADRSAEPAFGLFDLLALLRRRWEIVLATTIVGTTLVAAYGYSRPEIYSATAKLLIEPENRVVDLDSVVGGVGSDAIAIETQINLLQSRGFLERFASQSLLGVPMSADLVGELSSLKESGRADAAPVSIAVEEGDEDQSLEPKPMLNQVNRLASGLTIAQQGRSFIINLEYSSPDSTEAAQVANELAEFYIQDQVDRRRSVTGEASQFLEQRLAELRSELLSAEEAVQEYRSRHSKELQAAIDTTPEQIVDLTSLLVRARADRKEKETRLKFIENLRASGKSLESLTEVLSSPYVETLWEEDSQLRIQQAELRLELGDQHPKIQQLAAEREEVAERIDREVGRIIENTENELEVLIEREKSLKNDLAEFTGAASDDAFEADEAQIRLGLLQGNAEASRRIYEEFLLRFKQTREQEAIVQANTRMIARAQIPTTPSSRSPLAYAFIGLLGSSLTGAAIAYVRDRSDRKVRTGKDLSRTLGITYLGLTPLLQARETNGKKIHEYLADRPASVYAETIRSIYTKSVMSNEDNFPKVILVTSSLPNEGKTTFALSLATVLTLDGKNTIVIDLDLRHPSVLKELGMDEGGHAERYLAGSKETGSLGINEHPIGFRFVAPENAVKNPGRTLRSKRLASMIEQLRKNFDHIIVDTAPSLGLSDSKALLSHADACLFIVRWNKTSFETVSDALDELKGARGFVPSVVISQVDLKKQMRYGYGGLDDYYGKNSSYYNN